jgi:hypothetical protein
METDPIITVPTEDIVEATLASPGSIFARLSIVVHPLLVGLAGLILLGAGYGLQRYLQAEIQLMQYDLRALTQVQDQTAITESHYQDLADLKAHDVDQFREGMSNLAQSRKALFESGLSVQEERRLLEKQWDIMTTYLQINPSLQRIFLMRGDQPLESYLIDYVPIKAFGDLPDTSPRVVRIVSKERFAAPERGKSEMVNGKLQWVPPQIGTSVRSNALGEYVVFTNSHVILHGPPRTLADHEAFPHLCLGLSLEAARKIYQDSFIGTRIVISNARDDAARAAAATSTVILDTTTKGPHGN